MAEYPSESNVGWPEFEHAHERAILLTRYKVVFVPVPKSGCTSILWLLAEVAGYDEQRFTASLAREVSAEMTIHDLALWQDRFRWSKLTDERRAEIISDDDWLRFTTVRDPASRLWSAWQSKLLLREPGYVDRFGDAPWFPQVPRRPIDVIYAFRAFVRALAGESDGRPVDVHWVPQVRILESAPTLNFVGRLESMRDATGRLADHIGMSSLNVGGPGRKNSSLLPYNPAVFDAETAEIVNTVYADDFEAYGYLPLPMAARGDIGDWMSGARQAVPIVANLVERHERIATLHRAAAKADRATRHYPRKLTGKAAPPQPGGEPQVINENETVTSVKAQKHQVTP